jgi:cellulose synthase/poly-beta-1,6-N-acetylglucosamine synthase-like glycosyltransferase
MDAMLLETVQHHAATDKVAPPVPRVSVVAPTYHRPELLARCLAALVSQSLDPNEYEIIVADDAASDATCRQVEELAAHAGVTIRYVAVATAHGPAAARNAGWKAAHAPIIAFTDDDTAPDPNWLAAGVAALESDAELAAATGRTVVPLPDAPTDYERNESGLENSEFLTANCFCRRDVLKELGGFDERFRAAWREDSDLHFALLRSGRRIARVADAVVVHPVRPASWGISLKQQRKVQYDALLYKKHPALYQQRIRARPPSRYYLTVVTLAAGATALALGYFAVGVAALIVWAGLTVAFCLRRLRGNARTLRHVAEMALTSALIPPLSIFWRLYGAARFRVLFW